MPDVVIPAKIIKLLEDAEWICVATRGYDGNPSAANKFLLKCYENLLYIVDFVRGKTWRNIKEYQGRLFQ